jgi:hypothetical protein
MHLAARTHVPMDGVLGRQHWRYAAFGRSPFDGSLDEITIGMKRAASTPKRLSPTPPSTTPDLDWMVFPKRPVFLGLSVVAFAVWLGFLLAMVWSGR